MVKGRRYVELDAIRGIAVCGMMVINIVYFAYPLQQLEEMFASGTFWYSDILNFIKDEIFGGRMATIFALLFGLGMGIQWNRGYRAGFLIRRIGVLALLGLLHIIFLFHGDILLDYAIFGMLGILLLKYVNRPKLWLFMAIFTALFPIVMMFLHYFQWVPLGEFTGGIRLSLSEKTELFQNGTLWEQSWYRIRYYLSIRQMPYVQHYYFPPVLACYLCGLYLSTTSILKSFGDRMLYGVLFWLTLTFKLMVTDFGHYSFFMVLKDTLFLKVLMYVDQYNTSLLFISIMVLLAQYQMGRKLVRPFIVFGKTALSSYILQSVFAGFLFYSWGLACYNTISPLQVEYYALLILILIYAINLSWLRFYGQGPMERAWRFLSNRKSLYHEK